ncbi:hypothetical protein LXL04_020617 [Taraxacum kok-saghyz]
MRRMIDSNNVRDDNLSALLLDCDDDVAEDDYENVQNLFDGSEKQSCHFDEKISLKVAKGNRVKKGETYIWCPYRNYEKDRVIVEEHRLICGFMCGYTCWSNTL